MLYASHPGGSGGRCVDSGYLLAVWQAPILKAMNQAVTRLYVQDDESGDEEQAA